MGKHAVSGDVKHALLKAFHRNGGERWLCQQFQENPKAMITLLGKVVPQEVQATIEHNIVDIGKAMVEGQNRVDNTPMIDITPDNETDDSEPATLENLID